MYFAVIVLTDREMWKIEPVLASRNRVRSLDLESGW